MIPVSQNKIDEYTSKGWWGKETILDLLYKNSVETPERTALVDPYNKEQLVGLGAQSKQLTYKELTKLVDSMALKLKALGLGHDDVILIQLPNTVELVLSMFASARIGAIPSPLAMQARAHELNYAAGLTNAKAIITVSEFHQFDYMEMMREIKKKNKGIEQIIAMGPDTPEDALSLDSLMEKEKNEDTGSLVQSGPNEIFTLCWTSGTEAEPKAVPRTHNQWISIARVVVEGAEIYKNANIHGTFPAINMAGIAGQLIPWVITGGKFVLHHPFDMESFFLQLIKEEIYYTLMPPALLDTLAKTQKVETLKQSSVKIVASGSVPLAPWMVKFYQDNCNIGIVNFFASNEGVAFFSSPKLFPNPEDRAKYFPRFGGEGVKFDLSEKCEGGIKSRLTDPSTEEVINENEVVGELGFAGPTVFSGYWNRPDLNKTAFDKDGYYRSGDLFSIEGEKKEKYLFHGRLKDMIIRGGYNISPEEVETIICGHPKIKEAAVVGYPDERLGERVGVAVVPFEKEEITLESLRQYLKEKGLAKYKWPEKIKIYDALPRNPVQKILKRVIKEQFRD